MVPVAAAPRFGCAFSHADNFDPRATRDDGSCTFSVRVSVTTLVNGTNVTAQTNQTIETPCSDPFADNYNPASPVSYIGACSYSCAGIYRTLRRGWRRSSASPRASWMEPRPADLGLDGCQDWPETPRCYTDAAQLSRDMNQIMLSTTGDDALPRHTGVFVLDLSKNGRDTPIDW